MMHTVIKLDIEKDAWNWWDAINSKSHGVDWKSRVDPKLWKPVYKRTQKQAYRYLMPFLRKYYQEHRRELKNIHLEAQKNFNKKLPKALADLALITKHPIYRKSFTCFLTTFPRMPYYYQKGYVWLYVGWPAKCYLGYFLHEALHFQFIHYYKNYQPVKSLTRAQFEHLKEAMTVILNYELRKYFYRPDRGYIKHFDMRKKLARHWQRHHDIDRLIDYGAGLAREIKS